MASTKRSPITYEPAFGSSIFRSKSEVEGDLALLDHNAIDDPAPEPTPLPPSDPVVNEDQSPSNVRTNERTQPKNTTHTSDRERTSVRTNERTNVTSSTSEIQDTDERTNAPATLSNGASVSERTNERTNERSRVRHSFDIYNDQLVSLGDIQIARHRQTGRRPKLGDLAQEALDAFIAANERTNERSR